LGKFVSRGGCAASVQNDEQASQKRRAHLARFAGGGMIAVGILAYLILGDDVFPGTSFRGWWLAALSVMTGLCFVLVPNARWVQKAVKDMSWDVLVMNFGGDPPPQDEAEGEKEPKPMGADEDVRARIDAHLPGVDWSDPKLGVYEGDGFSFRFKLGGQEEDGVFLVHVRGGGEAIKALMRVANPNKWTLFDCSLGEYLDPENPSQEG